MLKEGEGVGVQVAQILGDDVQRGYGSLNALNQLHAGAGLPMAVQGYRVPGGDGPVGVEGAEVVDADHVVELRRPGHPLCPPGEDLFPVARPVVEGFPQCWPVAEKASGGTPATAEGLLCPSTWKSSGRAQNSALSSET